MSRFLTVEEVLTVHERVIDESGGSHGVRDKGLLESAVMRPQTTFGGEHLYPDLFSQAAALLESLTRNHPFVDGNKRTGHIAVVLFLALNQFIFTASADKQFGFILDVATGNLDTAAIVVWLQEHTEAI